MQIAKLAVDATRAAKATRILLLAIPAAAILSTTNASALPAVVLMDVQMPEMGGFEATAAIREREAGTDRRQPIVAMTAHALHGDRERCLNGGFDGYIAKPISERELLAVINHATAHAESRKALA
jgi:CheY-like chemotaxis protein